MSDWDYIVVGSGSSGSVVANRLSEEAGNRVLVLEAGGKARDLRFKIPAAGMTMRLNPKGSWCYKSEPENGLGGRRLDVPRGRVVGGSSAINGTVFNRGSPHDFEQWAALGLPDWDYASVLPYFMKLEDHWRGDGPYHRSGGPVPVNPVTVASPITPRALEAARQAGYGLSDDFSGAEPEGWGLPDFNVDKRGRRVTSAVAFLDPVLGRPNLHLETGAQVRRIIVEAGRAIGIEYEKDGSVHVARAAREIVLSAGAIGSPHLLLLSGIGAPDELRSHGVVPLHDLPGVGRNFNDQPAGFIQMRAKQPITLERSLRIDRFLVQLGRWVLGLSSVLTGPPVIAAANIRTTQGRQSPDMRFLLSAATMDTRVWVPGLTKRKGYAMQAMFAIAHPRSRGTISLNPADPMTPRIWYNLLGDPWDVEEMKRGYRLLREYLAQPALADIVGDTIIPARIPRTDEEVEAMLRQTVGTTAHPIGSCKMGVDEDAVVDSQCRVRGIEGLRVVDLSVFPVQLAGNPHAAAMMLGDRVGDMMLGRPVLPRDAVDLSSGVRSAAA